MTITAKVLKKGGPMIPGALKDDPSAGSRSRRLSRRDFVKFALAGSALFVITFWHGPFLDRYWVVFPWNSWFFRGAAAALAFVHALNFLTAWRLGRDAF